MDRFCRLSALRANMLGVRGVVSGHEQFGALCAALLAEKMGWPGTPVEAVLACQHKLYAREVLERIAPEANVPYRRLETAYGGEIPEGLPYPSFIKPVKAAFSVLAKQVGSRRELVEHTRFGTWELWIIRHLVEPFEKVIRRRLPGADTSHSLMLEEPLRGRQYCLDGYFFEGRFRKIGVVDAVTYPGTNGFMRFDYPSRLPEPQQRQAETVATRFMQEIGFIHGLFNMEFAVDPQTGQIKVIEFNPRMSSQFSDLYARVDGLNLHEMALALSHGIDPNTLRAREPTAGCAASFVYRSLDPTAQVSMPSPGRVRKFRSAFEDALLFQFPKLPSQIQRDFKWLGSYRYGIVHLGGDSPDDLKSRCERASELLGWPAPYVEDCTGPTPLDDELPGWPLHVEAERGTV
jgi:hypothetical protein